MSTFLQVFLRSLETGGVYALAALGIIIIFRTSNITHFAQGSMGMFNTFVVATLVANAKLPLWLATLCGLCTAIVLGCLVDFVIIRRAKKVSRFIESGDLDIFGAHLTYNGLFNMVLGVALMLILFYVLQKTKMGIAIRTTASNEPVARLMGVPTRNVTLFAWALAACLGCLSGVMIAPTTSVTPNVMDPVQVNALIACVLGGFQTFYGPVLGAYIIAVGTNLLSFYVDSNWGGQLMYLLVLVFIVFRPQGLVGKKFIKKV